MNYILIILLFNIISTKEIFEETTIKNIKFKNRLFKGAVADFSFIDGKMTEKCLKHYEEYAKNEIGTIITGGTFTDNNFNFPGLFYIDNEKYIPEYQKLTSLMHKYNTRIISQISHTGFNKEGKLIGPSIGYNTFFKQDIIEMSKEEILIIEDQLSKGALLAKKSGFDGVNLAFNHWGFLASFLSPHYNKRNDEYGGSIENRARFMIETIKKVRKNVGNDYLISLKINCRENLEDGITEEDFIVYCKLAEKAGVDLLEISSGDYIELKAKEYKGKPFYLEETIKAAESVNIPVMLIGGIRDYDTMVNILKDTKIEYFGIARPLICEPDLPKYWKENGNRKSKCISCNGCFKKHDCVFKEYNQKNIKE
jgi:2,4-dienoyl-CoA reductase-like NADH-dependent reductase (Old Yellow Enzyme family)